MPDQTTSWAYPSCGKCLCQTGGATAAHLIGHEQVEVSIFTDGETQTQKDQETYSEIHSCSSQCRHIGTHCEQDFILAFSPLMDPLHSCLRHSFHFLLTICHTQVGFDYINKSRTYKEEVSSTFIPTLRSVVPTAF